MAGESDGPGGATGGSDGGAGEGRPRPSPARLPSIRAPRDLTLASALRPALLHATKSRRVFVPNLDVKREKHDDKGRDNDRRGSRGDRRRDGRGRGGRDGRGRGGKDGGDRRRDKPELVQMSGSVFGEGIAAPEKRPSTGGALGGFGGGGGGGGGGRGGGGAGGGGGGGGGGGEKDAAMTMPVFGGNKKVDKEEEERKLAALLKDDFIADGDEEEATDELAPVRLPLLSSASAASSYVTDDVNVKYGEEEGDDNVHSFMQRKLHISDKKLDPELKLAAARRRETDLPVAAMLKDTRKDLIFFQFPDCLPVLTSNDDDGKAKSKKEPSTSGGATNGGQAEPKAPNPDLMTFSDLPEGQVGRLQIMKSGRARLLLGDHVLQLEPGTQVKFLQEAASVSASEDGSGGRLSVLGHVRHRVVASPAWDALIKRSTS